MLDKIVSLIESTSRLVDSLSEYSKERERERLEVLYQEAKKKILKKKVINSKDYLKCEELDSALFFLKEGKDDD